MRIFQGLGSLSEVLSKAKRLFLRERRETFRVRMRASTFREVFRDRAHEADPIDLPQFIEQAKNLTPDREKLDPNSEQKKKET